MSVFNFLITVSIFCSISIALAQANQCDTQKAKDAIQKYSNALTQSLHTYTPISETAKAALKKMESNVMSEDSSDVVTLLEQNFGDEKGICQMDAEDSTQTQVCEQTDAIDPTSTPAKQPEILHAVASMHITLANLESPQICVTLTSSTDENLHEVWCSAPLSGSLAEQTKSVEKSLESYLAFKTLLAMDVCGTIADESLKTQKACLKQNGSNLIEFLTKHEKISESCF